MKTKNYLLYSILVCSFIIIVSLLLQNVWHFNLLESIRGTIGKYLSLKKITTGLIVLLLCIILEIIAIGWKNSALNKIINQRSSTVKVDIFTYLFSSLRIIDMLAILFSFGISLMIPSWFRTLVGYNLLATIKSPILQNICFVIVLDFTLYWIHRVSHTVPALWELHKFHHSATEMTILTTARLHPLEIAINNVVFSLPLFILGIPVETYLIFFFFTNWLGHIHHSMIPWTWGFVGKYIFLSPAAHRIHHSTEVKHYNKNFGTVTPVWDRLFGTWYVGSDLNENVGVDDNNFNQKSVLHDYILAYRRFLHHVLSFVIPIKATTVSKTTNRF